MRRCLEEVARPLSLDPDPGAMELHRYKVFLTSENALGLNGA